MGKRKLTPLFKIQQRAKARDRPILAMLGQRHEDPVYFSILLDRLCAYFFLRCSTDHKRMGWKLRMTPYRLSVATGIDIHYVTKYLVERTHIPPLETCDRLLRGLGIDLRFLLSGAEYNAVTDLREDTRMAEVERHFGTVDNQLYRLTQHVDGGTVQPVTSRMKVTIGLISQQVEKIRTILGLEER